jgi:antitoxin MazE
MRTVLKKWGNSAALRIPSAILKEIKLAPDQQIDVSIEDGKLVLTPLRGDDLPTLLAQITDENKHRPIDFGKPLGKELL